MGRGQSRECILLVGCGNMGGAMLAGWLAAGSLRRSSPSSIRCWPKLPPE